MGVDNPCFLQCKLDRIVLPILRSSNLFDRNPDFSDSVNEILRRSGDSTDNREVRSVFGLFMEFIEVRRGCCVEGGPEGMLGDYFKRRGEDTKSVLTR